MIREEANKKWVERHKMEKSAIERYFKTGDRSECEKLGIKFVKPL